MDKNVKELVAANEKLDSKIGRLRDEFINLQDPATGGRKQSLL